MTIRNVIRLSVPIAIAAMVIAGFSPNPCTGAEPNAREIVDLYEKSLQRWDRAIFSAESKVFCTSPLLTGDKLVEESTVRAWRDGDKRRLLIATQSTIPFKGKRETFRDKREVVFPGQGMINVDRDPENGEVQGILAFAEPTDDTRKLVYGVDHAPIYGYLSGNDGILLPQLLRESTLSQWSESREGRRLQVIQGKGRWGTHTLWLDPEHDYLPHRIEQWKEGRDWWAKDKPVSNFPRDRGDRVWPKTQVRSLGERLEATKIEQINGDHVMTAFVWTKENVYETGETVTFRMEVRLSDVDLKPDFSSTNAFAVSTPVPNGTPVQVDDRRGIRYEWRDGQIVNSLNQEAITSLERHSFWRRSAWGRGLLALAIVVVAGGSVLMWYVRRARKAGVP